MQGLSTGHGQIWEEKPDLSPLNEGLDRAPNRTNEAWTLSWLGSCTPDIFFRCVKNHWLCDCIWNPNFRRFSQRTQGTLHNGALLFVTVEGDTGVWQGAGKLQ